MKNTTRSLVSAVCSVALVGAFCGVPLALPSPGAAPSGGERFFVSLAFRESPYADFLGVGPVSPIVAARHNHFRFTYDGEGRPVEIAFRLGSRLRPPNDSANYFFPSSVVRIDYPVGHEVRRFFDERDRPVAVRGGVYREVFDLDAQGRRTALRFVDRQGRPVENDWGIASYGWHAEADGSVTEWRKGLDGAPVAMRPHLAFGVLRLRYDASGLLSVMQNLNRRGALLENETGVAQDRLDYSPGGRVEGWSVLDAKGYLQRGNHPNVARGFLSYDDRGLESGIRYEDESGRPIRSALGWGRGVTVWDEFGNWRSRRFFDEHGAPMVVAELGYHGYAYEWDETGLRRIALRLFDLEGHPVLHAQRGFAAALSEYDERGRRIAERYVDAEGHPVERADTGVASIRDLWDANDFLVERRFLDAAEKPVINRREDCARIRYRYAPDGFLESEQRFDLSGPVVGRP